MPGVVKTSVGYTGGQQAHPSYEEVCMGITGHAEVVQVTYDPDQVRVCAADECRVKKEMLCACRAPAGVVRCSPEYQAHEAGLVFRLVAV